MKNGICSRNSDSDRSNRILWTSSTMPTATAKQLGPDNDFQSWYRPTPTWQAINHVGGTNDISERAENDEWSGVSQCKSRQLAEFWC